MSSTNGKCLSCGAVELGSILEHKKDCQVFPHTKDKTYRELDDIDLSISTRIMKDSPDFGGVQIDMRLRLTEKAKQAIQEHIEGEKYLNASEVLNEYLDSKDSNDQKVYMDGYLEWLKDRIKQLKDKGGSE